jgi:hypothetical protein
MLEDGDPVVRCTAARLLDEAHRKEAIDAYAAGLDDTESRTVGQDRDAKTYCFGAQAFRRLTMLARRHDAMDWDEFRGLPEEERTAVARDLTEWWKSARAGFSFNDTKWERFAAEPVVMQRIVEVGKPRDAYFRFRSAHDRAMVTVELMFLEFVPAGDAAWSWAVDWRAAAGVAGRRSGYEPVEARHVPVNRRWGKPRQGIGSVSLAVQRIGKERARVVLRFADFLGKR